MPKAGRKIKIWIVEPVYETNYGNSDLVGYTNGEEYLVDHANEFETSTFGKFGNVVEGIIKFRGHYNMKLLPQGGNGIFLTQPIYDENGLCYNPDYVSTPPVLERNKYLFNGTKSVS